MEGFLFARAVEAAKGAGHDRADFWQFDGFAVACLADGAGGTSGAAVAADRWMAIARDFATASGRPPDGADWCRCLRAADGRIYGQVDAGDTTAVVVTITPSGISGASVGDSGAWLFARDGARDLTAAQQVRPFLGSGGAAPVPFAVRDWSGTLLLATDGLWPYAPPERVAEVARTGDPAEALRALIALVRGASGALPDDLGLVLCRPAEA